jgi:hypothetical protein
MRYFCKHTPEKQYILKTIHVETQKSGVTLKQYVIGRRDTDLGTLNVGRYLALDRSMDSHVQMDALRPHAILICGKRGYGKSYTRGIFWTMRPRKSWHGGDVPGALER